MVVAGLLVVTTAVPAQAPQGQAENVRFTPGPGGAVTISYDLIAEDPRAAFAASVEISRDGGRTFQPIQTGVTGDVGARVTAGLGKQIQWQAGSAFDPAQANQISFRVVVAGAAAPSPAGAPASPAASSVVIMTTPPGAAVFVDDQQRGVSPITITDLKPGAHRIRLTRAGYLDNQREVTVVTGRSQDVVVSLTAASPAAGAAAAAAAQPSGGGGSPLKWILPVAAGGGAGAYFALKSKSDSGDDFFFDTCATNPALCTPPPVVSGAPTARFTSGVDGGAGVVPLAGLTTIFFDASSSSTGTGGALAYFWTFGDGGTSTLQRPTRVYAQAGPGGFYTVSLTVSNSAGSNQTSSQVRVGSMTGQWAFTYQNGWTYTMSITQSGLSLSGTLSDTRFPGRTGPLSGSVVAPRTVLIDRAYAANASQDIGMRSPGGFIATTGTSFSGTLRGTELPAAGVNATFTLR